MFLSYICSSLYSSVFFDLSETLSKYLEDGKEQQEAITQRKEERLNDIRTHRGENVVYNLKANQY